MKTVTICGSMRFAKQMKKIAFTLETEHGLNVLQCVYNSESRELTQEQIETLAQAHYRKIDLSDAIYVVDLEGYIGKSVQIEMEYAARHGKEIILHSIFSDKTQEQPNEPENTQEPGAMRWEWNKPVSVTDLSDLREAVSWNRMEKEYGSPMISSYYHIGVYDGEKLVAYIDSVSNGVTDAYIQDLMVHPDYQRRGIGTDLMRKMMKHLKENRIYMISVIYDESIKPFYERFGFHLMLSGQMETYSEDKP